MNLELHFCDLTRKIVGGEMASWGAENYFISHGQVKAAIWISN